jgi:hypothetical protein
MEPEEMVIARQCPGKHVLVAMDRHTITDESLKVVFL